LVEVKIFISVCAYPAMSLYVKTPVAFEAVQCVTPILVVAYALQDGLWLLDSTGFRELPFYHKISGISQILETSLGTLTLTEGRRWIIDLKPAQNHGRLT